MALWDGSWRCWRGPERQAGAAEASALLHLTRPIEVLELTCSSSFVFYLHPDHAFFVDEFTIVITDELDHFIIRQALIRQGVDHGFLENHRIVDRDLVVENR